MSEQGETKRKRGSVTTLALLVGLLLGLSGSAQARPDSNTARFDNGKVQRVAPGVRAPSRSDDNGTDDEATPVLLAPPPAVVTELVSARPAAQAGPAAVAAPFTGPHFHYRARAPPAA